MRRFLTTMAITVVLTHAANAAAWVSGTYLQSAGVVKVVATPPPEKRRAQIRTFAQLRRRLLAGEAPGKFTREIERFRKQHTGGAMRQRLELLLGHAYLDAGRPTEALRAFNRIRGRFDLSDFRLVGVARAYAALKQFDKAAAAWRKVSRQLYSPHRFRAEVAVAEMTFRAKKYPAALTLFRQVISRFPAYPQLPRLKLRVAQCLHRTKRSRDAANAYERVVFFYPGHSAAKEGRRALLQLARAGVKPEAITTEEHLQFASHLRHFKRWKRAIAHLRTLLKRRLSEAHRDEARYQLALAYYGFELYDKALATFRGIKRRGSRLRSWLFRTFRRLGKIHQAITMLGSDLSRAEVYFVEGHVKKAYLLLAKRHKKRRLRGKALWRFGWVAYRMKRYRQAWKLFRALRDRNHRVSYWLARTAVQLKRKKSAIRLYRELVRVAPLDYYGVQANNRLLELGVRLDKRGPTLAWVRKAMKTRGALFHWGHAETVPGTMRRQRFRLKRSGELRRYAKAHGRLFPQLRRARDLYWLGWIRDATWEVQYVGLELRRLGRSRRLAQLAALRYNPLLDNRRRKKGIWGSQVRSIRMGRRQLRREVARLREIRRLPDSFYRDLTTVAEIVGEYYIRRQYSFRLSKFYRQLPEEDRRNYRRAYPVGFRDLVEENCRRYGVKPYLLWAIITIESSFNPRAISIAGARGLMQVMPKTGSLIAERLKVADFGTEQLLDPRVSIRFGAWYMRQLIDKFNGQEGLAIPSYNGGPHNVAYWLKRKGSMGFDEFVEEIQFNQARLYIKKVVRFITIYRRLYSGVKSFYISNNLDSTYKNNINW